MSSAPMRFDDQGLVAWDRMWTDFCDLALAGGPPHRDTLLKPATADQIAGASAEYTAVLVEIERGLRLVTGLPIVCSEIPGWVGLRCASERMAQWLLRAIAVENVSVRREECVLYLPVGPAYRLEGEIKNVITVAAKTHHYWAEHVMASDTAATP
jgi:sirohydrochlorin cobaltochelatase